MKTTVIVYQGAGVRQEAVDDSDLRWFVSHILSGLLLDEDQRVRAFTVVRGESRCEHFQRLQKDDPDIFEQ